MRTLFILPCRLLFLGLALSLLGAGAPMASAVEPVEPVEAGESLPTPTPAEAPPDSIERDEQGRKHGEALRFHANGQIAERALWSEDQLHGVARTFDPDGTLRSAVSWRKGELNGPHRTYSEKGFLQLEQTYRGGLLHGAWKSYHDNKRLHVTTGYRDGKLHGPYVVRAPDGTTTIKSTFKDGLREGTFQAYERRHSITKQKWRRGVPLDVDGVQPYPRDAAWMRTELTRLLAGDGALSQDPLEADRELALRYLKAYRCISAVPYDDIRINDSYQAHAQAAAEVCRDVGHITHFPDNPGWDTAKFDFAALGTRSSNLAQGLIACESLRGYMDDSDDRNIAKVGHRAWCMNPAMTETGFGTVDHFSAMWSFSNDRKKVPDYDIVACPPPGLSPGPWFGTHWAWHVSMNKAHYDAPKAADIHLEVVPVDDTFLPTGDALPVSNISVLTQSAGVPYMIIFKPMGISLTEGSRYRVTVAGLTRNGKPQPLRYFVEFFDFAYPRPQVPALAGAHTASR